MRTVRSAAVIFALAAWGAADFTSLAHEPDVTRETDALFAAGRSQEAVDVLRAAAAQGVSAAQGELGGLYFAGLHVAQDYATAERLLRQALVDPKPEYKRDLACVLHHLGGAERGKESISLIEQAAAADDVLALAYESRLYRLGIGRPANPSVGIYKLELVLSRIHEPPGRDAAESKYLREHLPQILATGVCGPPDDYGAFLAKSFPMRYREWPAQGKRSPFNPLFLYLPFP